MEEFLILLLFGVAGGFLAGLLGVGGGIIFIPILSYYFEKWGLSDTEVVKATLANSLFLVFASGISGTLRQIQEKTLHFKNAIMVGIPGGVVSFVVSSVIAYGTWYKPQIFKLIFLSFVIASLVKMFISRNDSSVISIKKPLALGKAILVGCLAGIVVAISGLGGGIVMVPMFQMVMGLDIKQSSRLSLSAIPWLAIFPLIGFLLNPLELPINHTGYIIWPAVLPALIGVLIFAPFGIKTAMKTKPSVLRIIFVVISSFILIKIVYELL